MIAAFAHMKAVAVSLVTSAAIAVTPAAPAVHAQERLSTEQMYRNYMESGSIYYSPGSSGPPAHIVTVTRQPTMQAIEREAQRFAAGSQKTD